MFAVYKTIGIDADGVICDEERAYISAFINRLPFTQEQEDILEKDFLKRLVEGIDTKIEEASFHMKFKQLRDIAEGGYYDKQINLLAKGKAIKPNYNPYMAVLRLTKDEMLRGWF